MRNEKIREEGEKRETRARRKKEERRGRRGREKRHGRSPLNIFFTPKKGARCTSTFKVRDTEGKTGLRVLSLGV